MDVSELLCVGRGELKMRPYSSPERGRQLGGSASSSRRSSASSSPQTRSILRAKSPSPKYGSPVTNRSVRFRDDGDGGGDSSFTKLHINETTQTGRFVEPMGNDEKCDIPKTEDKGVVTNQSPSNRYMNSSGYKPPLIAYQFKGVPSLTRSEVKSKIPVRTTFLKEALAKPVPMKEDGSKIIKNMDLSPRKVTAAVQTTPLMPDGSKIIQNMTFSKNPETEKECQTADYKFVDAQVQVNDDMAFEKDISEGDFEEIEDRRFIDEGTQAGSPTEIKNNDPFTRKKDFEDRMGSNVKTESTQTGVDEVSDHDAKLNQGTQVDFKSNTIAVRTPSIPDGHSIVKNMEFSAKHAHTNSKASQKTEMTAVDQTCVNKSSSSKEFQSVERPVINNKPNNSFPLPHFDESWSSEDSFAESPFASPRKEPVLIYNPNETVHHNTSANDTLPFDVNDADNEEHLIDHCAMSLLKREPVNEKMLKESVTKSFSVKKSSSSTSTTVSSGLAWSTLKTEQRSLSSSSSTMSSSMSKPTPLKTPQMPMATSSSTRSSILSKTPPQQYQRQTVSSPTTEGSLNTARGSSSFTKVDIPQMLRESKDALDRYETIVRKENDMRPAKHLLNIPFIESGLHRTPCHPEREPPEKQKSLSFTPVETYSFKPGSLRSKTPPMQSTPRDTSPKNLIIRELDLGPIPKVDKERQNSHIRTPELSPRERVVKPVQFGNVSLSNEYNKNKRGRSVNYTSPTRKTTPSTPRSGRDPSPRSGRDFSPSRVLRRRDSPSSLLTSNLTQIRATAQRKFHSSSTDRMQRFARSETQVMSHSGDRSRPRTKARVSSEVLHQRDVSAEREEHTFMYSESLRDDSNARPVAKHSMDYTREKSAGGLSAGALKPQDNFGSPYSGNYNGCYNEKPRPVDKKPPLPKKRDLPNDSPKRDAAISANSHSVPVVQRTATATRKPEEAQSVMSHHKEEATAASQEMIPEKMARLSVGQAPSGVVDRDCVFLDEQTIMKIIQEAKL